MQQVTSDSVHGHAVMQMMIAAERGFDREALKAAMAEEFGADARFHTCSKQEMTADELIDLLVSKKKFIDQADGWHVNTGRICRH